MIAGLGTGSTVQFPGRRARPPSSRRKAIAFTGVTTSRRTQAQAERLRHQDRRHRRRRPHRRDHRRRRRGRQEASTASRAAARLSCGRRSWPPTPTRSCGSWTSPRSWTPSASSRCRSRSFRSAPARSSRSSRPSGYKPVLRLDAERRAGAHRREQLSWWTCTSSASTTRRSSPQDLITTVGVVEHGLFLNMVDQVIVGDPNGPRVMANANK